ncbi:MAG: hypothetical protein ABIY55_02955 [Kofleriaceae bacterium]
MNETHDSSPPEIPMLNEVIAVRARGAPRPHSIHVAGLAAAENDGIRIRDRDLRAFCRRLLSWSEARAALIDGAVNDLLTSAVRGTPIALRGVSDLVPVAYALHRRILGPERPFVVCDRRRNEGDGSVRAPPSRQTCVLALEAARGGSLCLRANRLPSDFDYLCRSLREGRQAATVFVCLCDEDSIRDLWCRPLEIPALSAHAPESGLLVQEVFDDAALELETSSLRLPRAMRQNILDRVASFSELEKTALRVVALASSRNISQAATRLGMAPVSLTRWLERRRWLRAILSDLNATLNQADK